MRADVMRSDLNTNVSHDAQNHIRAGLIRAQLDRIVSADTQSAIRSSLGEARDPVESSLAASHMPLRRDPNHDAVPRALASAETIKRAAELTRKAREEMAWGRADQIEL